MLLLQGNGETELVPIYFFKEKPGNNTSTSVTLGGNASLGATQTPPLQCRSGLGWAWLCSTKTSFTQEMVDHTHPACCSLFLCHNIIKKTPPTSLLTWPRASSRCTYKYPSGKAGIFREACESVGTEQVSEASKSAIKVLD